MSEHVADGREVDPGFEKHYSGAVPDAVRMESFLGQCRCGFEGGIQTSGENMTNSKSTQRLAPMVDKEMGFRREFDLPLPAERSQHRRSLRPDGQYRSFFPLPKSRT